MSYNFIKRTACIDKNYKDNEYYFKHEFRLYKYL